MRVTRVVVKKLFGIFDHDIPFNLSEKITIIHGANGFGKTIILKMINGLLSFSYGIFYSTPFEKFELWLDNGARVEIKKGIGQLPLEIEDRGAQARDRKARRHPLVTELTARHTDKNGTTDDTRLPFASALNDKQRREVDRYLPRHLRLIDEGWIDTQTNSLLSADQVLRDHEERLIKYAPDLLRQIGRDPNSPLGKIQFEINCHLIGTERLQKPASVRHHYVYYPPDTTSLSSTSTVERYSQEIVSLIGGVLATYAGRASELDRTFPARLLYEDKSSTDAIDDLKARFKAIEGKRANLITLGFLDPEKGSISEIPEALYTSAVNVLAVYVSDTEKKLSTFDEMAAKIGLLMKIINERFSHKRLKISREKGFVFHSKLGELSPANLSSGEQHELVLVFELLFKVDKTWLVLLDEPEISLHVGWQVGFLQDLQEIVKLSSVDVLIATHSPVVIGEHWDLTVDLKGPIEQGELQ